MSEYLSVSSVRSMVGSGKFVENQHKSYFYVDTWAVCFSFVCIILCFTVPGQVVDLALKPSPHSISLEWKKPSNNGDCVTRYTISWIHTGSGNTGTYNTGKEEYSFVIGSLDACVLYEISVSAVNKNNQSNVAALNATTETDGK
jgi:hypothetical protein